MLGRIGRLEFRRAPWWALAAVVGLAAFLVRLGATQRGGLYAVDQYDASVYFGAAVGLIHGYIPYRDFLFLHPPGMMLALTPFAALSFSIGDANAMAAARLAWMGLGAANAILVASLLKPVGRCPAVCGGLFYAAYFPAVVDEQTTRLEGLTTTCLLGACLLIAYHHRHLHGQRVLILAGMLLGLSATVKIWGVIPFAAVVIFLGATVGLRRAVSCLAGGVLVILAICLPFLIGAPGQMWRQVVRDQTNRPPSSVPVPARLADISGVGLLHVRVGSWAPVLIAASVVAIGLGAIVALGIAATRLSAVLLIVSSGMLISVPVWYPHYAALVAGPVAISVGSATHLLFRWRLSAWKYVSAGLLAACLVALYFPLTHANFGVRFPRQILGEAAASLPGCITADDPGTLIGMDVLSRNLKRGCPLILDLDGYSLHLGRADQRAVRGEHNEPWQRFATDYLRTGSATIITRQPTGFPLLPGDASNPNNWPVIVEASNYALRRPIG